MKETDAIFAAPRIEDITAGVKYAEAVSRLLIKVIAINLICTAALYTVYLIF